MSFKEEATIEMNEKRSAHTKRTLLSIRKSTTTLSTEQIARAAGVSIGEAYAVEIGGFARTDIAQKVLDAFSTLTGIRYTLDDIRIHNTPRPQPESHAREWTVLP